MNVLIVGLGSIARKHVQAIRSIDGNSHLYALRHNRNSEETEGIISVYDWKEVDFTPDFILISNPTSEHAATIEKAIEFNCPLFIEKPSLFELTHAEKLLQLIRSKKIITYVGCDLRFHPVLQFMRSYIETNRPVINEVNIYCGSYLPDWRPGVDHRTVYAALPELGGGVHLDLIHEPDYCYWIFGKPLKSTKQLSNVSSLQIRAYDYANFTFEYPSFNASIILNYYRRDTKRTMEIITDQTTLTVDLIKGQVTDHLNNIIYQTTVNWPQVYQNQMQHFVDCIKQQKESINSFEESIEVLKMCIA